MFWRFVRKELLTHLRTLRLVVALVFTVVLSAMAALTGSIDYARNWSVYEGQARQYRERLDQATTYSQVTPRLVFPPRPLSILARGSMQTFARETWIGVEGISIYAPPLLANTDSQFMKTLVQIDFTTVVALLLSFLAVVLGFDGISGEREQGTLKQILTQPVPRSQVVLAKLVGGALTLAVPFALGLGVSLLILLAFPQVTLTGQDWVRLAAYFVLSCLFLGLVYALSLLASTLTRQSDTALIICLFAWLVSGVGYLNALPSVSRYAISAPPNQTYLDRREELFRAHDAELREWQQQNPPPASRAALGLPRQGVYRYGRAEGYDWLARREAFRLERRMALEDQLYQARWAVWAPLAGQARAVERWSLLSPLCAYQHLAQQLARTTIDDLFYLSQVAREYRQVLISWLRGKGAFSSWRWFTDDPPGQEPLFAADPVLPDGVAIQQTSLWQERMRWAEEQDRRAAADPARRLDLSDLPEFAGVWQRPLADTLNRMLPGLAVLLLAAGAATLGTIARLSHYDPS